MIADYSHVRPVLREDIRYSLMNRESTRYIQFRFLLTKIRIYLPEGLVGECLYDSTCPYEIWVNETPIEVRGLDLFSCEFTELVFEEFSYVMSEQMNNQVINE
jgi:hypothetical protein